MNDIRNSEIDYNILSFEDEIFYQNLLAEVKGLPFNRMTLIDLFLEFAINFLNKSKKSPIAKGLEWYIFMFLT
jgi:hypothetical protein